jgi:DNA-binding CsgD family transcriptional regulator
MKTSVPVRQEITPRDIQVARWIARGKERNEVASILGTSRSAINRHMIKIMRATGAKNGTQAVVTLMALGLLSASEVSDLDVPARREEAQRIAPDLSTPASRVERGEVAAWLRSQRVPSPVDDAEEHVNACLDEMASEWEARA